MEESSTEQSQRATDQASACIAANAAERAENLRKTLAHIPRGSEEYEELQLRLELFLREASRKPLDAHTPKVG